MTNPWKLTSLLFAGALALSTSNALVPTAGADVQPKMRSALDSLKSARTSLEAATHDKGGHRKRALDLTKQAIDEVQKGIAFDNKH